MPELPLTMPKMSMTMEEGTMVVWLKNVGDSVRAGEPICEVATDKVDMEVESPFEGVIARIIAGPDEVIKVGEPIAYITTDADDLLGGLFDEPEPQQPATIETDAGAQAPTAEPDAALAAPGWPAAVPLARVIAAERSIDLATLTATGPWGAIRVSDVEARATGSNQPTAYVALAVAATVVPIAAVLPAAIAQVSIVPANADPTDQWEARRRRTRTQVAKVMALSAAVPQFTAFVDLDLSVLAPVRKTTLGGASWTAILVRAQAQALAAHPQLNASWIDGAVVANAYVGIALAVDSPAGLLVPVLTDPQLGSLSALTAELAELIDEAKLGNVAPSRRAAGTSVFSNLGGLGVESFNALITPPQATALSAGAVRNTVIVVGDGAIGVRLSCTVGLTVDHRVADGADAARYLQTLKQLVADPNLILAV